MDRYAELPLDLLLPPEIPMRETMDPAAFAELIADVKANGIIQPIVVSPEGQHYRTVAGERRRLAAIAAGLLTAPCVIRDLTALRKLTTTIRENLQREDPPPLDGGRAFARLQDEHGLATDEIAALIHKSSSYVATRLRALRLPGDVQEALRAGQIGLTAALELGKVLVDEDRAWLLHHTISGGATAEVVRSWVVDVNQRRQNTQAHPETAAPVVYTEAPPQLLAICDWHRGKVPLDKTLKIQVCADCYTYLLDLRDELARQERTKGPDARALDSPAVPPGG